GVDSGTGVTFAVTPGAYPLSASAPRGYAFTSCGSTAYTVGAGGVGAALVSDLTVAAGGTAEGDFYVAPLPPSRAPPPVAVFVSTGTLTADILSCGAPGNPEVAGGLIATSVS